MRRIDRAAAGERSAFGEFFDRHSSCVLGVLVQMIRRREVAEELLQEAFLQAWRQADRYRPQRATPRGWLLMIARSRAIDWQRSQSSRSQREQVSTVADAERFVENPIGTGNIEADERRRALSSAMQTLSVEQRECIQLAYLEGLSHSQVAQRLGQPLGTVKSRILLGMNKMRQAVSV